MPEATQIVTAPVVETYYNTTTTMYFGIFLSLRSKYTKIHVTTYTRTTTPTRASIEFFYDQIKHIIVHGHFTLTLCLRYWAVLQSAAFSVSKAIFDVSRCRRAIENYVFGLKLVNTVRNYNVYVVRRALSMANNAVTFDENVKFAQWAFLTRSCRARKSAGRVNNSVNVLNRLSTNDYRTTT